MASLSRICLLTPDDRDADASGVIVRTALEAGIRFIQFRRKSGSRRELLKEALQLRELTAAFGAMFIVNDYADIALAVNADGLHVGQEDLPVADARKLMGSRLVGVSTHSMHEALRAAEGGADYIGFGPIFHTETKDAGEPQGIERIREIKRAVSIPVVAIGGITSANAAEVFMAECDSIAVSAGICRGDVRENARLYILAAGAAR